MNKNGKSFPGRSYKKRSAKNGLLVKLLAKVILFFRGFKASLQTRNKTGRTHRLGMYAAGGFVVFAVLLTVVLAGGGNAAPKPEETQTAAMLTSAPTPIPTTLPDITPIPTTPPDIMATPEPMPKPTPKPTPKKAEKPEEKPSKTPKPTKTPKPQTPQSAASPQEVSGDMGQKPASIDDAAAAFVVQADAYYNDIYSSNSYEYTSEEKYILAKIIQIEANGQSPEGMIAVGNVVMNRVLCSGKFGNNITDVVVNSSEFPYKKYSDREPSQAAINAASVVLDSEDWVLPQNAYNFNSGKAEGENWGSHVFWKKIGEQCFYTNNYKGRNNNGSVPPKLFERTYKYAQYGCKAQERVKRIQYMLSALGYSVSADGVFGKGTTEALKKFQASQGLGADGVAGTDTVKALINALGFDNYCARYYG